MRKRAAWRSYICCISSLVLTGPHGSLTKISKLLRPAPDPTQAVSETGALFAPPEAAFVPVLEHAEYQGLQSPARPGVRSTTRDDRIARWGI